MKYNYGKTEKNDIFRRADKEAERTPPGSDPMKYT